MWLLLMCAARSPADYLPAERMEEQAAAGELLRKAQALSVAADRRAVATAQHQPQKMG